MFFFEKNTPYGTAKLRKNTPYAGYFSPPVFIFGGCTDAAAVFYVITALLCIIFSSRWKVITFHPKGGGIIFHSSYAAAAYILCAPRCTAGVYCERITPFGLFSSRPIEALWASCVLIDF